ncbi:MAG: hypothetical protein K2M56_09685 [Muribaculaceae bacterium]|nr:hypothetical protein [Muribaculaceae bacterium]
MTTAILILSAIFFIAGLFFIITSYNLDRRASNNVREARALNQEAGEIFDNAQRLRTQSPAILNPKQVFFIDRINGRYCVVGKYLTVTGDTCPIVIKYIFDDDDSFARRECEEIIDVLLGRINSSSNEDWSKCK